MRKYLISFESSQGAQADKTEQIVQASSPIASIGRALKLMNFRLKQFKEGGSWAKIIIEDKGKVEKDGTNGDTGSSLESTG